MVKKFNSFVVITKFSSKYSDIFQVISQENLHKTFIFIDFSNGCTKA